MVSICKKTIILLFTSTLIGLLAADGCDPYWTAFQGKCYRAFPEETDFYNNQADAKTHCQNEGGDLITIESSLKFEFLKNETTRLYDELQGDHFFIWWTAGQITVEGNIIWDDGEDTPATNLDDFWFPSYPDYDEGTLYTIGLVGLDDIFGLIHVEDVDENPMNAFCQADMNPAEGDVRLIGGLHANEGVAQMYIDGSWGYICDSAGFSVGGGWPSVFCKTLNGEQSSATEAVNLEKIEKKDCVVVTIEEDAIIAFQMPKCSPRDTTRMIECSTRKGKECKKGLKDTVWVVCSE